MLTPATSLDDALAALQTPGTQILAGGTDVYPALQDHCPAEPVIDISRIPALRGLEVGTDRIRIGAATCWTDIAKADLPPALFALQRAARQIGGRHIQNAGTIAGNICNASPAADGIPPLLILDAEVELHSHRGQRSVPLEKFVTGNRQTLRKPDEIITAITLPSPAPDATSAFEKLGSRSYLVISIAMVALLVQLEPDGRIRQARVAVGACSPVAQRLEDLEKSLIGQSITSALIDKVHLQSLSPIDDARGSAEYRRIVVARLIRRALQNAGSGHG